MSEPPKSVEAAVAEEHSPAPPARPSMERRAHAGRVAVAIYAICTIVYAIVAGDRLKTHSPDNHFSYLADSYLHGTLAVRCSETDIRRNVCPPGGGGNDWARYENHWYVAFPSFPAVLYMPAVAVMGRDFPNRAYDIQFAGLAPALLFLLLERLAREGRSVRSLRENVLFSFLFAFGTVYFFIVVQGSVWFTAQMIVTPLVIGYLWFALDARKPLLAGLCLALAIHTRANFVYASPLFALEALRVFRRKDATGGPDNSLEARLLRFFRDADWSRAIRAMVLFALPVGAAVLLSLALNKARFGDYSEPGYRYLQIAWRGRIERWGLFNYHYLSRNLAIALASLPWITRVFPYVTISLHGLAVWFTTPQYLELPRLRRREGDPYTPFLALTAVVIAATVLFYQSSGWIQFGYRYSNDFAVFLFVLLAICGRRIGKLWIAAMAFAVAVNAFGAITFDRTFRVRGQTVSFYDNDYSQQRYFQPD